MLEQVCAAGGRDTESVLSSKPAWATESAPGLIGLWNESESEASPSSKSESDSEANLKPWSGSEAKLNRGLS